MRYLIQSVSNRSYSGAMGRLWHSRIAEFKQTTIFCDPRFTILITTRIVWGVEQKETEGIKLWEVIHGKELDAL